MGLKDILCLALLVGLAWGQSVEDHNKIVACYHQSWSYYRPDNGHFEINDFDATLCTHGIYAFAGIDNATWTVRSTDTWLDLGPLDEPCPDGCTYDGWRKFVNLKQANPDFVPMLSVGGFYGGSSRYSEMAADETKRASFIASLLDISDTYGFEGFDVDWEYPGVGPNNNETIDMEDFSLLLEEMSAAFQSRGLVLSAVLGSMPSQADSSYDTDRIFAAIDFATLLTYEYHGYRPLEHYTAHHAPLYPRPEENTLHPGFEHNVFDTMNYYIYERGVQPLKLLMGIATHGVGYELAAVNENGLYCSASGPVPAGPFTQYAGGWSYQEILFAFNTTNLEGYLPGAVSGDWEVVYDSCYYAPYMLNYKYWLAYDDPQGVTYKIQYAKLLHVAGAAIWSMNGDDFNAKYSPDTYPLVKTVNSEFSNPITFNPDNPSCGSAPMCSIFGQ